MNFISFYEFSSQCYIAYGFYKIASTIMSLFFLNSSLINFRELPSFRIHAKQKLSDCYRIGSTCSKAFKLF